eukprot:2829714-Pleurochrysis_carterae.AAC.1
MDCGLPLHLIGEDQQGKFKPTQSMVIPIVKAGLALPRKLVAAPAVERSDSSPPGHTSGNP